MDEPSGLISTLANLVLQKGASSTLCVARTVFSKDRCSVTLWREKEDNAIGIMESHSCPDNPGPSPRVQNSFLKFDFDNILR